MVITKRAIEPNNFLCSLIGTLTQLLSHKAHSSVDIEQSDKLTQMERDIINIKEELKQLKGRSVVVSLLDTSYM